MAKQKKRLVAALLVGGAIGVLVIGGASFASRSSIATSNVTDNVRVVEDRKAPEKWAINAAYGRGALSNLRSALDQISNDNVEEARKGIAVAQSLLGRIEWAVQRDPRDKVHQYADSPEFVLVHSEVRVLESAQPGADDAVQQRLDALRDEIDMTDHGAIMAALESLDVPLTYTRVDLPLSETIGLVNDAISALDKSDIELARSKLLAIGEGLRIATTRIAVADPRDAG